MQALRRIVGFRRGFASSGAASTEPGFLLAEQMRKLVRMPRPVPEPLRTLLPMVSTNGSTPGWSHFKPDLSTVRTVEEASTLSSAPICDPHVCLAHQLNHPLYFLGNAISRHTNQEPVSVMRMLRIATRPAFDASMLQQVARNIFAEALEEMREEAESTASASSKGKREGAGIEEEVDASVTFQLDSDMLLEGVTPPLANDSAAPSGTTGLADHIHCSGVLKKRRRKMRRHKHKKRLRKNRYKNKK